MSGPARCVAQVRLTLEDLGDMTNLEDERQVLQVEIAMELAKSASIPIHDIRDMQGQVGKGHHDKGSNSFGQTDSGLLHRHACRERAAGPSFADVFGMIWYGFVWKLACTTPNGNFNRTNRTHNDEPVDLGVPTLYSDKAMCFGFPGRFLPFLGNDVRTSRKSLPRAMQIGN